MTTTEADSWKDMEDNEQDLLDVLSVLRPHKQISGPWDHSPIVFY